MSKFSLWNPLYFFRFSLSSISSESCLRHAKPTQNPPYGSKAHLQISLSYSSACFLQIATKDISALVVHTLLHTQMAKPFPNAEIIQDLAPVLDTSLISPEDRHCTICQESFQNPGRITRSQSRREHAVRLPCNHVFGNECITRWLAEQDTCPYCRRRFHFKAARPVDRLAAASSRRQFPEVRIPASARLLQRHSRNQLALPGTIDSLWTSGIPAFADLLVATEEAINLLNCYLLILTIMDSGRAPSDTEEEREQMVVAFEYLSRVRPGMLSSVYALLYRHDRRALSI